MIRRQGPGRVPPLLAALLLAAPLLAGCNGPEAGATAGGVSGVAATVLSSNPAVGYAVGLAVRAAVDSALSAGLRSLAQEEQDRIAAAAGDLEPGQTGQWSVDHGLPFGFKDAQGRLAVTRVIDTPLARCREVFFSLDKAAPAGGKAGATPLPAPRYFTATTCQRGQGWKWATAEPAVERWGALQ